MGDVGEVGEVASGGELVQAADGGGQVVVVAADGVVEGEGEFGEPGEEGQPGVVDVGVQVMGAVGPPALAGVVGGVRASQTESSV
ncbi:hypothetical protein OG350_37605 [Streptomyces achromogenes]|uniref:Uncharacterized protein n=1 Tax=Streptomyces achromogenes TaxID=67255 RepID=A0ABZ1KGD1_STRAH